LAPTSLPEICACITSTGDLEGALAVREDVALYEVRIDLIGDDWRSIVGSLPRPWIACNRVASEGGAAVCPDDDRLDSLRQAVEAGAHTVDIELSTAGAGALVAELEGRVQIIVSYHDTRGTGSEEELADIVARERGLGADVCKVVTTAQTAGDNATVLRLARRFSKDGIVALAMGPLGMPSRVLAPLAGARFTYASLASGHESAPGQLMVGQLREIYETLGVI
jgi:3-dehydroquinate dehydratase-1